MNYYVYKFLDKDGNALYVGQTIDMDRRMSEHKGRIWDLEKDKIMFAKCNNQADMCLYEMYYINKLHAKYNDCLVYNVEPSFTLPELDFREYTGSLIEEMRTNVRTNAQNDFLNRFSPENYWRDKKEKLEGKIKEYSESSEEYKNIEEQIKICDDNLR